jgi:hypothetical protein
MIESGVVRGPWWWDLEDDQYIGEFEDDDDGANAAEWEAGAYTRPLPSST